MADSESYKANPYFGELTIGQFNQWTYMARWTGLSVERREIVEEWVTDNFRGPFSVKLHKWMVRWPNDPGFEKPEWSNFVVYMMSVKDFMVLKCRFNDVT